MPFGGLKPLRGWRAFAGDVGIIVLGVLVALGAEHVVQTLNQRSQLRELREAVDTEIAYGLGRYEARLSQQPCVEARLAELTTWLQLWRSGQPVALLGPISAPRSGPTGTSVWQSRDPGVMTQMPLEQKLAYGSMYDSFANNEVQRLDERMTWLELAEFDGADQMDASHLMRLQGLITRAQWRANNITNNGREDIRIGAGMGIKPQQVMMFTAEEVAPLCKPILPAR